MSVPARRVLSFILALILLLAASSCKTPVTPDTPAINPPPGKPLPVIGTAENLQRLVRRISYPGYGFPMLRVGAALTAEDARASLQKATNGLGGTPDHSTTNVQVEGVDEGDLVKTDGEYIYFVNEQRIAVVKAYPPDKMSLVTVERFDGEQLWPHEIYIDGNLLVVVGWAHREFTIMDGPAVGGRTTIYPPPRVTDQTVKVKVYDMTDRSSLTLLREVEVAGYYIASRKIGSAFYLVANKYLDMHILENWPGSAAPAYRDTAGKDSFVTVGYDEIRYFPGFNQPNYLMVAGFDLADPGRPAEVHTYLGAGENIYASLDNLYVAVTRYEQAEERSEYTVRTGLYRFALAGGRVSFSAEGEVPGTVLNQFSMDEYGGYLRVAVTTGFAWWRGDDTSENHLYILDGSLNTVGKVEGLAPGERIYSARFLGEKGYVVTFRTVDPLFALDLSNPRNPRVLGELKIPGYSTYLHPYDENHLLGFGMDAEEVPIKDETGRVIDTVALNLGMKISLFDVSDMTNPVEKFVISIGGRGTHSDLLYNHRALLFSRERELLAFPVSVAADPGPADPRDPWRWGRFEFQGVYVYRVNAAQGFTLMGKVTHLPAGFDPEKHWAGSGGYVQRALYIGDVLYTLSPEAVQAHSLPGLSLLAAIPLK